LTDITSCAATFLANSLLVNEMLEPVSSKMVHGILLNLPMIIEHCPTAVLVEVLIVLAR
jgi:hypothetical protein